MKNKLLKILLCAALVAAVISSAFASGCGPSSKWFKKTVNKYYYYPVEESSFEETDFKAYAEKYLDRYSAYYTKAEYADVLKSNSGSRSGIGISYSFVQGKGVYISTVTGNSPAYMCGLRAGEWLEGGSSATREVTFNSAEDFSNLINSAADGEPVNLTSTDGEVYTVAKSEYTASYTYMATRDTAWTFGDSADGGLAVYENPSEKISYLPEDAAYISISQFYGTAAKEFDVLLKKFNAQNYSSLIIDLRSNGGGYVSVMQDMAYAFSGDTKALAMLSRDKNGKEEKYYCTKVASPAATLDKGVKVYVLANSGTASASEALIGAMVCYGFLDYKNIFLSDYSEEYMAWLKDSGQDLKTAQSYGKGIMQSTFVNRTTGEALKLTTAQIYWPDGKTCIHDKGVTAADGCTPVSAEWQHTKSDVELLTAVEIIKTR